MMMHTSLGVQCNIRDDDAYHCSLEMMMHTSLGNIYHCSLESAHLSLRSCRIVPDVVNVRYVARKHVL